MTGNDPKLMDPATFGIMVARVIKRLPYSQNWLLVSQALEEGGTELDDVNEVRPFIEWMAALPVRDGE